MYDKEESWTNQEALKLGQTIDIHCVKRQVSLYDRLVKAISPDDAAVMKTERPSEELLYMKQAESWANDFRRAVRYQSPVILEVFFDIVDIYRQECSSKDSWDHSTSSKWHVLICGLWIWESKWSTRYPLLAYGTFIRSGEGFDDADISGPHRRRRLCLRLQSLQANVTPLQSVMSGWFDYWFQVVLPS